MKYLFLTIIYGLVGIGILSNFIPGSTVNAQQEIIRATLFFCILSFTLLIFIGKKLSLSKYHYLIVGVLIAFPVLDSGLRFLNSQ